MGAACAHGDRIRLTLPSHRALAQVVRARKLGDEAKREYAVKTWMRNKLQKDRQLAAGMRTELEALEQVAERAHPHVANLVEVLENRPATHCVLEYCGGGSLLKYLQVNAMERPWNGHGTDM